jgi:DNA-binding transcriptional regulator YiaG
MTPRELKALRASLGWSQARLAEEIGVAENTVTRWEMGRHPISAMVEKLLRTLRTKPT